MKTERDDLNAGIDKPLPVRPTARRPYRVPELVLYGDLNQITHNVGMNGAMDGAAGSMHSTQL